MSLNCVEIEAVIETLPQSGIIKKVFSHDKDSVVINIFDGEKDYFIHCSVQDGSTRLFLMPENQVNKSLSIRFSQILNANVIGGRLDRIYQANYSRVVIFNIKYNEKNLKIIARLWGTGSNIILLNNDNIIIDCLRRMPKRDEWPKEEFSLYEIISKDSVYNNFTIREEFRSGDINNAVFDYYNDKAIDNNFNKKRNELELVINKEINACNITLKKISYNIDEGREEDYRESGELLKANIYKIKRGMDSIELDKYDSNQKVVIKLLADKTPSENIEKYFEKYKKVKKGRESWQNEKVKIESKLKKFIRYSKILSEIDEYKRLLDFEKEISSEIRNKNKENDNGNSKISRCFILDGGYEAYVSKSAEDADQLLKNVAKGNDYWFHVRDYAGSHVIVKKSKSAEITDRAKIEAAMIAVYYSKGKNDLDADVYFTQVKYLHKSKGGPAGLVFPVQEKNIKVRYDKSLLDKIFARTN